MPQCYTNTSTPYVLDDAQQAAQLRAMRREDSSVVEVRLSCSHAALYILESSASVHWRKVGIEGFFYIVMRDSEPRYRMILRNQTDSGEGDFVHAIDDKIQFEIKEDTFFYQIGDSGIVRGLWFHDKGFMPKFIRELQAICRELGLICEGAGGSDEFSRSRNAHVPSHAPGMAILGMIRKSDQHDVSKNIQRTSNNPVPSILNPMDMIRQELAVSGIALSSQRQGRNIAVPTQMNTISRLSDGDVSNNSIAPDDIRRILVEMISTDDFVFEFAQRVNRTLSKR